MKNLTNNQLVLIALAAVLLLVAAFSFYLLQNPSNPLPFMPVPATSTPTPIVLVETAITTTPTPTRRTSYTPLALFLTPALGTPSTPPIMTEIPSPLTTTPGLTPPGTLRASPSGTLRITGTPPSATVGTPKTPTTSPTASTSATATSTLSAGEVAVTGRVIQNGTPMPNVVIRFEDDTPQRQSSTNAGGHYSFVTLAPGSNFLLTFKQSDNLGLTPAAEITSLALIKGTLPTAVNPIDIPDLEISINQSGMLFALLSPVDGVAYPAGAINASTPLPFSWSLYNQGGSYSFELGPNGVDQPTFITGQQAATSYLWDGTLTDGTHITAGNYWWRVAVTKSLGNYVLVLYTQPFDITFNP